MDASAGSPTVRNKHVFRNLQPLILASESPRRMELLHSLGLHFTIVPSGIEEEDHSSKTPALLVEGHALKKARFVSDLYSDSWVLSADTVVALEDRVFGKPATADQAFLMLQQLSGRRHRVYTGLCLMRGVPAFAGNRVVETEVRFKALSDDEIRAYVATGEPLDKAGAYGIQGPGAFLVESIHGSYTNVVGLPVCETLKWLLELGIVIPRKD